MRCVISMLLAACACLDFASLAAAADLPVKARLAPAEVSVNWAGFYAGLNAGFARTESDFVTNMDAGNGGFTAASLAFINATGTGSASKNGFTGGGQIGYNWQWNANSVLGIEADLNALRGQANLSRSAVTPGGTPFTIAHTLDPQWMATVRGRAGVVFDRTLVYATGGLAVLHANYNQTFNAALGGVTGAGTAASSSTKAGWTAGGGVEVALNRNWSVKAEYLYASFSKMAASGTVINTLGFFNGLTGTAETNVSIARGGFNYRF